MKKVKLMLGDNIQSLKKLPDNSIDSVVSDPPYGLSFMGKKWDYDVPSVDFWKEVYRVLKPGGYILSFGGTRTYHRMVVNIEDAGFEIRDQIQWLYGSGFPKSYNIGKGIQKFNETGNAYWNGTGDSSNGPLGYTKLAYEQSFRKENHSNKHQIKIQVENEWEGWGSALKPANEPICLARKPLSEKSIAENVLKWRTGGLNIDGCRIGSESVPSKGHKVNTWNKNYENLKWEYNEGRFPANLILDETAAEMLDEQSGTLKSGKAEIGIGNSVNNGSKTNMKGKVVSCFNDSGGASRFFYVAKVSKAERNMGLDEFDEKEVIRQGLAGEKNNPTHSNNHPTIKPVNLMSYLCKLITPPNGIVLDPFMGSGSTGIAALLNDFRFVGMEMDDNYYKIAEARIENYEQYKKFLKK